jgi:hypothetical protein
VRRYRHGTTTTQALKHLYKDGGIPRYALIVAGDIASHCNVERPYCNEAFVTFSDKTASQTSLKLVLHMFAITQSNCAVILTRISFLLRLCFCTSAKHVTAADSIGVGRALADYCTITPTPCALSLQRFLRK